MVRLSATMNGRGQRVAPFSAASSPVLAARIAGGLRASFSSCEIKMTSRNQSVYECPVCGEHHPGDYLYVLESFPDSPKVHPRAATVCWFCADAIANIFNIKHSGEPLTWSVIKAEANAYRKIPIPMQLRWDVFKRDNFTCVECGDQTDLTADHRLAERHGGAATMENLVTLCRPCNSRKGVA